MVVLQRITPFKFVPVRSAPVKFVGGVYEMVSLPVFAVIYLASNPYQTDIVAITIIIRLNLFIFFHFTTICFLGKFDRKYLLAI
jgi:hypothetical protein